jgi:hypothetical protein
MESTVDASSVRLMADHLGAVAAALRDLGLLTATIGSDVPYADFVLHGTRAHDILPRDKQALFWPGAAHPVAIVHHPGYPGNDFLTAAVDATTPVVAEEIGFVIGSVIEGEDTARIVVTFHAGMDEINAAVKAHANVKTGRLRDSFTVEYGR